MNYQYKAAWTMAAIGAIAGAIVFCGDYIYSTEKVQTKQIVSCILVFWYALYYDLALTPATNVKDEMIVAVIRTYMTIVWGFGVAKPVTGLQPQTVGAEEDTEGLVGRTGMTAPKRRIRRET